MAELRDQINTDSDGGFLEGLLEGSSDPPAYRPTLIALSRRDHNALHDWLQEDDGGENESFSEASDG